MRRADDRIAAQRKPREIDRAKPERIAFRHRVEAHKILAQQRLEHVEAGTGIESKGTRNGGNALWFGKRAQMAQYRNRLHHRIDRRPELRIGARHVHGHTLPFTIMNVHSRS